MGIKRQLEFELSHLAAKLKIRDNEQYKRIKGLGAIETHPLFYPVDGDIETWEVL